MKFIRSLNPIIYYILVYVSYRKKKGYVILQYSFPTLISTKTKKKKKTLFLGVKTEKSKLPKLVIPTMVLPSLPCGL